MFQTVPLVGLGNAEGVCFLRPKINLCILCGILVLEPCGGSGCYWPAWHCRFRFKPKPEHVKYVIDQMALGWAIVVACQNSCDWHIAMRW